MNAGEPKLGWKQRMENRFEELEARISTKTTGGLWSSSIFDMMNGRTDYTIGDRVRMHTDELKTFREWKNGLRTCPSCKGLFSELLIVGSKADTDWGDRPTTEEVALCHHCAANTEIVAHFAPIAADVNPPLEEMARENSTAR